VRIHVTCNAGAGKTTFARALAAATGLPLVHRDGIVWRLGWRKASRPRRLRDEATVLAGDAWIVEGVSTRATAAADLVVWLDLPEAQCLARARARCRRLRRRNRPELPPGCPEQAIASRLERIVRRFRLQRRRLLSELRAAPERVLRLTQPGERRAAVAEVAARAALSRACR
jgi:adenylate kinase family enzyme